MKNERELGVPLDYFQEWEHAKNPPNEKIYAPKQLCDGEQDVDHNLI